MAFLLRHLKRFALNLVTARGPDLYARLASIEGRLERIERMLERLDRRST